MMQSSNDKLRLGIVPYLNVQPMVYGLQEICPQLTLMHDHPSILNRLLNEGAFDVGILPVFAAFAENRAIYPGPVIASQGEVYSVLIVSRRPIEQLRAVRRDANSLTSNALARVLLANYWKADLEEKQPLQDINDLPEDEGQVLIGDRAIRQHDQWAHVYDLGQAWREWTGLPFVFAAWIGRTGLQMNGLRSALESMLETNMARLEEVALSHHSLQDIDLALRVWYLKDCLSFTFGEQEQQAIVRFHQECKRLNLTGTDAVHWGR